MSNILAQVLIASAASIIFLPAYTTAQPAPPEPRPIRYSKPVSQNNASFVMVMETEWSTAKDGHTVPIEIQLQIVNTGKEAKAFRAGTVILIMTNSSGKKISPEGGSNHSIFTRPILVPPGATFSLVPKAELRWDEKAGSHSFFYSDGRGLELTYGPLPQGKYDLRFLYSAPPSQGKGLGKKQSETEWTGEVFTEAVRVRVSGP